MNASFVCWVATRRIDKLNLPVHIRGCVAEPDPLFLLTLKIEIFSQLYGCRKFAQIQRNKKGVREWRTEYDGNMMNHEFETGP